MSRCGSGSRPGCGKEIQWGVLPDGGKVPLDLGAPIYRLGPWDPNAGVYAIERITGVAVSHFKTCPQAQNFSGAGKKERKDGRQAASGD